MVLKRVPIGLEWPVLSIWWGYTSFPRIKCECCLGIGMVNWVVESGSAQAPGQRQRLPCPICKNGEYLPIVKVPEGIGYQIWATYNKDTGVNEHHYFPLSPEYTSPYDLAEWMSKNFTINDDPLSSEQIWHEAIQDNQVDVIFGLYKATHERFEDF